MTRNNVALKAKRRKKRNNRFRRNGQKKVWKGIGGSWLGPALKIIGTLAVFCFIIVFVILYSQRIWDGEERVSFVVQTLNAESNKGGDVSVISYLPLDKSISVVSFPSELKINTTGEFGFWRIESIYHLGELEGNGGELLKRSVADYLGAEVEGWLVVGERSNNRDNIKKYLSENVLQILMKRGGTNFYLSDLIRIYFGIRSVPAHKIEVIDLKNTNVLFSELQPDGSEVLFGKQELMDEISREIFSHPRLVREDLSVEIFNSTENKGLGKRAARLVSNMGMNVVSVLDYPSSISVSKITVSEKENQSSFTARKLSELFDVSEIVIDSGDLHRAEVQLIVGEDYWKFLTEF